MFAVRLFFLFGHDQGAFMGVPYPSAISSMSFTVRNGLFGMNQEKTVSLTGLVRAAHECWNGTRYFFTIVSGVRFDFWRSRSQFITNSARVWADSHNLTINSRASAINAFSFS